MTKQKNVTNPYYYVGKYERIMGKLFYRQMKTDDDSKFQRYIHHAHRAHYALMKYVEIRLYGYHLIEREKIH